MLLSVRDSFFLGKDTHFAVILQEISLFLPRNFNPQTSAKALHLHRCGLAMTTKDTVMSAYEVKKFLIYGYASHHLGSFTFLFYSDPIRRIPFSSSSSASAARDSALLVLFELPLLDDDAAVDACCVVALIFDTCCPRLLHSPLKPTIS